MEVELNIVLMIQSTKYLIANQSMVQNARKVDEDQINKIKNQFIKITSGRAMRKK